jgi:hypothetical protein
MLLSPSSVGERISPRRRLETHGSLWREDLDEKG